MVSRATGMIASGIERDSQCIKEPNWHMEK